MPGFIPLIAGALAGAEKRMRPYTVKPGDTLSGIAKREMGDENKWRELYRINASNLDCVEQDMCLRGFGGEPADWIFPGTVIQIPQR